MLREIEDDGYWSIRLFIMDCFDERACIRRMLNSCGVMGVRNRTHLLSSWGGWGGHFGGGGGGPLGGLPVIVWDHPQDLKSDPPGGALFQDLGGCRKVTFRVPEMTTSESEGGGVAILYTGVLF